MFQITFEKSLVYWATIQQDLAVKNQKKENERNNDNSNNCDNNDDSKQLMFPCDKGLRQRRKYHILS